MRYVCIYERNTGEYATNQLALDAIEIPPRAYVVDIGCGTGSALRHAAGLAPDARLVIVKDEGAPTKNDLLDTELPRAGFKTIRNQRIAQDEVAFELRVCERSL